MFGSLVFGFRLFKASKLFAFEFRVLVQDLGFKVLDSGFSF